MEPIKYWNCAGCNYPVYTTYDDILLKFSRMKKCPNCMKQINPFTEQHRIKDERPADSSWKELYRKKDD